MPRKAVLSAAQQVVLTALPTAEHDLRLHYTLSENDLSIIRSKRGPHNRLGFAIQLCYLRFPGQAMTLQAEPPAELLAHVAQQIQVAPDAWPEYAARDETGLPVAMERKVALVRRVRGTLVGQGRRGPDNDPFNAVDGPALAHTPGSGLGGREDHESRQRY